MTVVDSNPQLLKVGLTCGQMPAQWSHDIATATDAGIDGFALNIGPSDSWNTVQLDYAYGIAEQFNDFVVFISFEYVRDRPVYAAALHTDGG